MAEEKAAFGAQALSPQQIAGMTEAADDFFTVFSNSFRIAASPTEFRLVFGENSPDPKGKLKIVELFDVVVTPPQAKLIAENLANVIGLVEAQFGSIPTLQSLASRTQQVHPEPVSESPKN